MSNTERLKLIRKSLDSMTEFDGDAAWYKDNSAALQKFLKDFRELDESLSKGGFYPSQWT